MNMMQPDCLMCGSTNHKCIDSLPTIKITAGYLSSLKIQVDRFFPPGTNEIHLLQCMNCDLRWYTPQTAGDAKFYEDLQQVDWYYQEHKPEYDFARTLVKQADRVLEVGCGKGAFRKDRKSVV